MFNLFKANESCRQPNENPPDFTPDKNQGEKLQGPGPVISGSGLGNQLGGQGPTGVGGPTPLGGTGPIIIGQGAPNQPGGQGPFFNPGGPGGGWQPPHLRMRRCIGKFTYIWLNNGSEFWFFVQAVTPRHIFGWRVRRGRLERGRIALNRIDSFYCFRRD